MVQHAVPNQNTNDIGVNKSQGHLGEMKKLLDYGWHGKAQPGYNVLSGKKHTIMFSTQGRIIRPVHQLEVNVIGHLAVSQ